jgi:hypothetical protein
VAHFLTRCSSTFATKQSFGQKNAVFLSFSATCCCSMAYADLLFVSTHFSYKKVPNFALKGHVLAPK